MSKRIIKANQKVLHDSMEEKKRFHLYKSGKLWLVAGLATLSFATGGLSSQLMPQSVHADVATSTAATKTDDSTTSSAASSAAPSAAALKTSVATSSATSSSASSEASSASSSEATSKATSKAADQNSSATSSSATSKANSSSASKASSAATTKSSSKATSAATKSVAATTNSSAVKKATTSAKSSAASSQELKTKFHLDDVATVKQTGNQLVFSVAANKKLTDEQYQAIVDYATRNHLKVKGLPKQSQATHKASAGTDLSNQFFAKHSMDKNAAHDGDSITLNGDVVTISLVTDVSHAHYLTHAETQKLYDYIKSKNLKVVDQTLVEYNSYYDAKGNLLSRNTDRSNYEGDFATIEYRCSDPLIGLFYQAGKENSRFWKDTKWYQDILDSRDGHWQIAGGEDNTSDDFVDNDLGLMFSHTINGAAASDSFIIATELKDESTSFYIDNGDGTKLDLFNDRDDVTNTISWSRTGENDGPAGFYHYAGERTAYIFSADQVNEFIRAQAYAYEHEDDGATLNGQQIDGQEAGRHNAIIQPLNTTNKYQVNQIINIYDADGNLLYYVTELATGGEIIVNSDATIADLINTADDVSAKGNYDITDVFDNFANGLNGDGTKGDGIRYRVNDGKTPSNDPKGTGTGAYSGNYADSLADGVPDIDYYMIEQADATITYVDDDKDGAQVGDPVKVTGDIDTDKTETITIPDGYEYVGTDGKVSADGKTVTITLTDDDSDNVTVHLKHHLTPVTPDDPSDPNYDATHATSHETIHYVDENGDQVFEDGGGELNFTRTVTIDDVTNEVVEYGEWAPVTDGEFPAVTSPDKDGYTPDYPEVDAQTPDMTDGPDGTVKDIEVTVTYKADPAEATVFYVDDDNEGNVVKTEITKGKTDGLGIYTVKIPDGYEYVGTDGGVVSADGKTVTITFAADDSDNVVIHLKHGHKDVDPSDPDDPCYADTHATVTQTVHYRNGENGKQMQADTTNEVNFNRTVTIDSVTGEITHYGDWEAVGDDYFKDFDSSAFDGYFADVQHTSEVKGVEPEQGAVDDVTINYYATDQTVQPDDPKDNGDKVDPSNPNSPVYPAGVTDKDLNKTVTETIHYVDPETGKEVASDKTIVVHYTRVGHVIYNQDGTVKEVKYDDWVADGSFTDVDSPVVDGYFTDHSKAGAYTVGDNDDITNQGNFDTTVYYYKRDQPVDPSSPKNDGDKINPDDPFSPSYPDGVDYDDLNAEVKQEVHYVDQNGKELTGTYTITVHYTRTAVTHYDENGEVTGITYSDWDADGSFAAVQSPDIDGYFTLNTSVAGKTVTDPQNQADFSDTVIYYKTDQDVTPDDPKTPNTPVNPSDPDSPDYPDGVDYDDLNADVKETVHYVGENGNELAESYTKTVHYERTAHIKYDKDGNATVTYGDWTADGSFDAVQSPDVDGHFTLNKTVDGKTVTDPQHQADFEDTVIYYKSSQNVTPDDPKAPDTPINPSDPNSPVYPDGVDEDDLNQDVTETIHYIDAITG